nr:hypothetical protein [Tanacetum cinerariifolium]
MTPPPVPYDDAIGIQNLKDGTIPSISIDSGNVWKEVVSPSAVDETVTKERQSPLMETTGLESYPPLPTQGNTTVGTAPGKSSYANVTCTPSGTKVNVHTFFTPGGNGIGVVVPVEPIRSISKRFANTTYGFFWKSGWLTLWLLTMLGTLGVNMGCEDGLSAIATKIELKDNIVVVMPKITGEGYYTCNIRVEYEWRCACCKKMGFKTTKQQVYQPVSKKPTTNHEGNKKKNVDPANEVSKSNSFDALNSVNNDVELGNNGGSHLASQEMENIIINGKASLVDNEGKPLRNVDDDSEDGVASDDNEMASFLAKKDGYGTQSLLEQWKDSHELDDYEYAPYDDDMYEGHEILEMLQAFCDNLDIKWGKGRGVKEKSLKASNIEVVKDGTIPSISIDSGNVGKEVVSPSAVDETVTKERQSPLTETTGLESYPPLPMQGTTTAGTAHGKSSYANVTGTPSGTKEHLGKYGLVRSMFSSSTRSFSFQFNSMDGLNAMLENGPWFILNNPLILKKWHPDVNLLKEDVGTIPVWVKFHGVHVTAFSEDGLSVIATKIELKDNIVAVMPKITKESNYTCNIRVEYEWRCACCKVFGHVLEECPKNICVGVTKNLKKTSQIPKGIPVGQKMGFKPTKQQVYQPVSKKPTTNYGGNKKKNMDPANEVSKSNSFDALNSVDNDVELGNNGGSTHLASQEANYNGSSFWNVKSSSPSLFLLLKINKMENIIIFWKANLVDNEGKPLRKVNDDREDEVASDDNEMASFLAKKDGYGTQSLLEQWKDSHELDDYEYDSYDDDMYEGHEIPEMLQAFYDNLDIKVRGRKNK